MRTSTALTMMLLCTLYEIDARKLPDDLDKKIDTGWTPEDRGNDEYLTSDTRHDRTLTNPPKRRTWRTSPLANSYNSHPWSPKRTARQLPCLQKNNCRRHSPAAQPDEPQRASSKPPPPLPPKNQSRPDLEAHNSPDLGRPDPPAPHQSLRPELQTLPTTQPPQTQQQAPPTTLQRR
ncbi:Hypothetical predicted protein [Cloeon dipterum]|uniref:Uncharacterized protein n=1 Tax=Cloeon dipterum TaxID=197152 RepID=A0A8S1BVW9_9INSE|nr:Hypothetical predicted protein [Cloeon dipterum]